MGATFIKTVIDVQAFKTIVPTIITNRTVFPPQCFWSWQLARKPIIILSNLPLLITAKRLTNVYYIPDFPLNDKTGLLFKLWCNLITLKTVPTPTWWCLFKLIVSIVSLLMDFQFRYFSLHTIKLRICSLLWGISLIPMPWTSLNYYWFWFLIWLSKKFVKSAVFYLILLCFSHSVQSLLY